MIAQTVMLQPPDARAFAPYGHLVVPPDMPGKRQFYSDTLHTRSAGSAQILHVNHVLPQTLPIKVSEIERHSHAAQCFFPIDVGQYIVMVMPSDDAGQPLPDHALAFLMPGTVGVIFNPGVWHLGATVLDRPGHFTVLMWRGGASPDDEFRTISPMIVIERT